jgi:hypothetical protein
MRNFFFLRVFRLGEIRPTPSARKSTLGKSIKRFYFFCLFKGETKAKKKLEPQKQNPFKLNFILFIYLFIYLFKKVNNILITIWLAL